MRNVLVLLLLITPIAYGRGGGEPVKLQCKGTYDDYQAENMRNIPVQGIYVEVSGNTVQVSGSPGFDGSYVVTGTKKSGVGFELPSNSSVGGFVNRFSGELMLTSKVASTPEGGFKVNQMVTATCRKAEPMF